MLGDKLRVFVSGISPPKGYFTLLRELGHGMLSYIELALHRITVILMES